MTDFAIIGGGIAGVSAAAHLAPHGQVVLFERESRLSYHTTGRSAAMLVENYGSEGARPMVTAARPFLEDPPAGSVDTPLLSDRAVMWVSPAASVEDLERQAGTARQQGADPVFLDPEEVISHVPVLRREWVGKGLLEESGADIDVAGLHQAFVRIARRHDTVIYNDAPVTELRPSGGRWLIESREIRVAADVVVDAAGAWGDHIAVMAGVTPIGLQPMRRTAFMVPGSEKSSGWPMVVESGERFYFRPDGAQYLCSLADETPSEPTDARPRLEDVALAIERINEATTMGITTVNSQWAGLRTFAPDRELVIGEDPAVPGFYWLVGQGGTGIQTSPAYGKLLSCLVTGEELPRHFGVAGVDPDRLSPSRLR